MAAALISAADLLLRSSSFIASYYYIFAIFQRLGVLVWPSTQALYSPRTYRHFIFTLFLLARLEKGECIDKIFIIFGTYKLHRLTQKTTVYDT